MKYILIDNKSKLILEMLIGDLEHIHIYFDMTTPMSNGIIIRAIKLIADNAIKVVISDNHSIGLGSYAFGYTVYNGITQSNIMRFITILKEGISKS